MIENSDRRMYYYNNIERNINGIMFARSIDEIVDNMQNLTRELKGLTRVVEDNIRLHDLKMKARRLALERKDIQVEFKR